MKIIVIGKSREGKIAIAHLIKCELTDAKLPVVNTDKDIAYNVHKRLDALRQRLLETGEQITIETQEEACPVSESPP